MSESQKVRIDLDMPRSGWLRVELSRGDQRYTFIPSHVPYDSISELVTALLKTLDGYGDAYVRWNDEPVEHRFVFVPQTDHVEFRAYRIDETPVGREEHQVFGFSGATFEVVWPFWKALREMQSRQTLEEFKKEWREPFPEREMGQLTSRINELKEKRGQMKPSIKFRA